MKAVLKQKFRGTLISLIVFSIVGALAILLGVGALMLHAGMKGQIEAGEGALRKYIQTYGAEPEDDSPQRREFRQFAQEVRQEFIGLCKPYAGWEFPDAMTPLAFKERLFQVQDGLRGRAAQAAVGMPDDLGFEQYVLDVPAPEHIPRLTAELRMLEDLADRLIASRIFRLTTVSFLRADEDGDAVRTAELLPAFSPEVYSARVAFESGLDGVRRCLERLAQAGPCYVVQNLRLIKHPTVAGRLSVVMDISYIGLPDEERD